MNHALIVDDDTDAANSLAELVALEGFSVSTAHSLRDARRQLAMQPPDLVLLDVQLPDGSGLNLFEDQALIAQSEVVLITGHASLETSIQALRVGAADYIVKPIKLTQLQGILSRTTRPATLSSEVAELEAQWLVTGRFGKLWGQSSAMHRIYEQITRVAVTSVSVFITGESGTGKEVVAQTLHELSRRRKHPFLAVNCGAISPNLIESEIFGHEKGSFTGADRQHQGFFERAHGGTLFLDEITEMPLELQVKLLRVLETGLFMRVGSTQARETDVRVIAATNRPPEQAVAEHRLRADLLYRLNVFPIQLPPLRERLEDIPLLANHFLADMCQREGQSKSFTPAALAQIATYPWPGNVRELRNVVQRAFVMTPGASITGDWLPSRTAGASGQPDQLAPEALQASASNDAVDALALGGGASLVVPIGVSLAEAEQQLILATLQHCKQQRERTAAVLGISLKTLYNRLKDYNGDKAAAPLRRPACAEVITAFSARPAGAQSSGAAPGSCTRTGAPIAPLTLGS